MYAHLRLLAILKGPQLIGYGTLFNHNEMVHFDIEENNKSVTRRTGTLVVVWFQYVGINHNVYDVF